MSDAPRHPDHERVKQRLVAAFTERYSSDDAPWHRVAAEAIAMGARAPDPREELVEGVYKMLAADYRMRAPGKLLSREVINYVLDNAPKGDDA